MKASYVGGLRKSIEDTMRLVRVAAVLALAGIIRTGLEESGGDQAWLRHAEGSSRAALMIDNTHPRLPIGNNVVTLPFSEC